MVIFDRKKQRGQRRKWNALLTNMNAFVPFQAITEPYEHFHVPSSMFIQSPRTSRKIKTAFCKRWLEITEEFMEQKPAALPFCKVVALIDVPDLWSSQIIIFYRQDYYNTFWTRTGPEQTWVELDTQARSFIKQRNIMTALSEKGYREILCDDEHLEQSTLWFYGEFL